MLGTPTSTPSTHAVTTTQRRVVVTGLGAVSPLGITAQDTWTNAIAGKSGIGPITQFDLKECPVTFAGEVKGFDVTRPIGPYRPFPGGPELVQGASTKDVRKMGRYIQLSIGASIEAYGDSGLDAVRNQIPADRIGVNIGVGIGGLPDIERVHLDLVEKGYKRVTPFLIPMIIPNMPSGQISILLNAQGPNLCNVTACSSSAHAIGESFHIIQRGDADIMITGGAESTVSPLGIGGFAAMRALSTRNEAPEKASRPFDANRDGFVLGEGAATLVLEEYEHAKRRGAKIYGEIVGYGLTGDSYHITLPAPEGEGGFRAMQMALRKAGIKASQIGYINAHGTSTPAGDVEEARAIARLFESKVEGLHVSSTKSMTGHLLGAAGAMEALLSIKVLETGIIPPTINLDQVDPGCESLGICFTPNTAVKKHVDYALSNSFGFGGTNASLLFARAGIR